MAPRFIHLRLHSDFSLADSLLRIKPLVKAVAAMEMPALALTDQGNMFGMVQFYRAAMAAGIKPIIGADLQLQPLDDQPPSRITLLCRSERGYRHLTELVSLTYTEGQQQGMPLLDQRWLTGRSEGLIALLGSDSEVGRALLRQRPEQATAALQRWRQLFDESCYLEVSRCGRSDDEPHLHAAVELAADQQLPIVATNDVRFLHPDDFEAHEVRVCIHEGRTLNDPRRQQRYSEQQYLRTPDEMVALFADLPEALANSVEIARRCSVEIGLGTYYLPDFPIPEGLTLDQYFRQLSAEGLEQRLDQIFDRSASDFATQRQPYDERLQIELDVIIQMGFPGYFLIVADFIRWAKRNAIPVGPGRGSGAGSLVAYALLITDLDPLAYDLLFERFLNPERVSMPDFDIDFCMEGRDRVIDYVAEHYGREKVGQIITYGTMAAKAVVRDVGRVLGHPYGFVDGLSKLIPFEIGITLEKALAQEPALQQRYEQEEEVTLLIDMARKLEGLTRNAGKHAGGVVIGPSPLTDFAPLYCEPGGGSVVTQFDKNDVEAVGLVKFDFLGLRTLTIIDWALANIRTAGGPTLDIATIPLDDRATFDLLRGCQTTAVFQLESRGMKELIGRLQPDCFEDIIALVALFRPGPLQSGMVDNFINRKHGREAIAYPDANWQHLSLQPILEPTYGIILYQEQVMQIAQVLAGYTLGGADLLRRAMGKKKPEEMAKQRSVFAEGAERNGIESELAMHIFDLVEKFAGYGFNKSHSAAYALVSYQTAWLKAHYPAAFMAAVLSADMDNTDKVVTLIDECRTLQLPVVPPDVNHSRHHFGVTAEGAILYGLGAIKGVGEGAIESIVNEREAHGHYHDLFDFCARIDSKRVNRRVLEALIRCGAFDRLPLAANRATLQANLDSALRAAEQQTQNRHYGVDDLFGFTASGGSSSGSVSYQPAPAWDDGEQLALEKEVLGLYLSGHPIERYLPELSHFTRCRLAAIQPARGVQQVIAGWIIATRTMNTKRGDKMTFVTLDDRSGRIEVAIYAEHSLEHRQWLERDRVLVVEGEVSHDEFSGGLRVRVSTLYDLAAARQHFGAVVMVTLTAQQLRQQPTLLDDLKQCLQPYSGGQSPLWIRYRGGGAQALATMGEAWQLRPEDALLRELRACVGAAAVSLQYQR